MLFEKFSRAGSVLPIRVCRDKTTLVSLGYAYVNFRDRIDAERELDTMNFDTLNGKPMRILWSQSDPSFRRWGNGCIFIRNLDKFTDNKSVYDVFSVFGNIRSCKVILDDDGNSKRYGFVHFETNEAAENAINRVNGVLLAGKKLYQLQVNGHQRCAFSYTGAVQGGTHPTGQVVIQATLARQPQSTGLLPRPGRPTLSGVRAGAPLLFHQYQQPQRRCSSQAIIVGGQEPLTTRMLAEADPLERTQLLGERIYALKFFFSEVSGAQRYWKDHWDDARDG